MGGVTIEGVIRPGPALLLASTLALLACNDSDDPVPFDDTGTSSTTAASSSSGADTRSDSTTAAVDDTVGTGSGTGSVTESTGTTSAVDDTSTGGSSSSGPSESSSSGEPQPDNGCADGEREAFEDEVALPDIAGCAGAWDVPGVVVNVPYCDRQAGDDMFDPLGAGCSVEDLCAEGWHVCVDRIEVMDQGIASCNDHAFGGSFFATRQSGNGSDTCANNGVNDVFGCGDTIGHPLIVGCAPLNRSTGNGCIELPDPWACATSLSQEAEFIIKPGIEYGGVICCRD